jgi:hypothetical protein
VDAVAYAALHLLRHVFQGDTKPLHVYEIARFLAGHVSDGAFWTQWSELHSDGLRRLQTVAQSWFACPLPDAVREESERLPAATRAWFENFATAPAVQRFRPDKHDVWLHVSLLQSRLDALAVVRRRLIPSNLPPPARATATSGSRAVYLAWFWARLRHHVLSFGTTLAGGIRWWWRTRRLSRGR